ncbi:unnamed protein product [Fusarium graminearum]|uniref:BZIP domain-containing protein n=1 Tax=Gibberella zeae TaxID=5518 RepID=A0A4E9ELW8_GIBZA|nr:unnamed protein product [Fusarium graminearum]CAG1979348.1 unnamed protein product [Fusarium graminearum]CAG1998857.1 unnamed protein product [Fusarium graminearum]
MAIFSEMPFKRFIILAKGEPFEGRLLKGAGCVGNSEMRRFEQIIGGGRRPLNLNQWQQRVHPPPPAASPRPCPGSLLAAPASLPSNDLGIDPGLLLFENYSPYLEFLPADYNGFDGATWDFGNIANNNNTTAATNDNDVQNFSGDGLFDNIMIPELNVLDTQSSLDVAGDGFLSQEQPLLTVNSTTPIEYPATASSSSSTPHPPPTIRTKSPTSTSAIPGTSTFSLHPSPSSSSSSSSSRKRKSSPEEEDSAVTLKRQRNTLAARKYRQKRIDRITELEEALAAKAKECDDWKLKFMRKEAENDTLREMLAKK